MKQELFSMFTKMEHWKDRGGLLTQAAPTPAGRQAVLRHVKELLTHYTRSTMLSQEELVGVK